MVELCVVWEGVYRGVSYPNAGNGGAVSFFFFFCNVYIGFFLIFLFVDTFYFFLFFGGTLLGVVFIFYFLFLYY